MISALVTGYTTTFVLAAAIGAQSMYVLRQGIRREHVALTAGLLTLINFAILLAMVAGIGAVLLARPGILDVLRAGGALYLLGLTVMSLRSAFSPRGQSADITVARHGSTFTRRRVVRDIVAITLLNPQMWVDIALIAAIAASFGEGRWAFAAGGLLADASWYCLLALAARALAPFVRSVLTWRILDLVTAVVLAGVAVVVAAPLFS